MSSSVPVSPKLTHHTLSQHTRQHTNPTSFTQLITPRNLLRNVFHPKQFVSEVALNVAQISENIAYKLNTDSHSETTSIHSTEHSTNENVCELYMRKQVQQALETEKTVDSDILYNTTNLLKQYKKLIRQRNNKYKKYISQLQHEVHSIQQNSNDVNNVHFDTMYNALAKKFVVDNNDELNHSYDTVSQHRNINTADSPKHSDTHAQFRAVPVLNDLAVADSSNNDNTETSNIKDVSPTCVDSVDKHLSVDQETTTEPDNEISIKLQRLCSLSDIELPNTDNTMISNTASSNLYQLLTLNVQRSVAMQPHNRHTTLPYELCSSCYACNTEFTLFKRRHHCRQCSMSVCAACSTHTMTLNYIDERVCDQCYVLHNAIHGISRGMQRTNNTLLVQQQPSKIVQ